MRGAAQHGFTLLELVVALGIFGLMSVLAYGGLNSVLQTREQVNESMERLADLQRAVFRFQSDLESTQFRPIRDEFGDLRAAMLWDNTQQGLEFTRGGWRNPLNLPRSSMQRVAYFLEEKRLVRRNWQVLDRAQDAVYTDTDLLEDVEEIKLRFLSEGDEWQAEWPPANVLTENPPLPKAVELTITTEDVEELKLLFRIPPADPAFQQTATQPPPPAP